MAAVVCRNSRRVGSFMRTPGSRWLLVRRNSPQTVADRPIALGQGETGSKRGASEKPAEDIRRLVRHQLDQSLWRVLIEAHLQQLQPVVVELPEEPLQTRIEE